MLFDLKHLEEIYLYRCVCVEHTVYVCVYVYIFIYIGNLHYISHERYYKYIQPSLFTDFIFANLPTH